MPYTRVWDETSPPGTILANTIDTEFQHTKTDIAERLETIFGLTALEFAADPIVPKTLTLSISATAPVFNGNLTGNITGTVLTAAQPNITSLGTLSALNIGGVLQFTVNGGSTPNGSIFKSATHGLGMVAVAGATNDFNILNPGAVSSILRVPTGTVNVFFSGALTATGFTGNVTGNLTGTILTAAQANITSLGIQTSLQVTQPGGFVIGTPATYGIRFDGGNLVIGSDATHEYIQTFSAKALELNNQGNIVNIGGNTTINAGLTVTGNIVATLIGNVTGNITGTVLTAAQANITSVGTLTNLNISGNLQFVGNAGSTPDGSYWKSATHGLGIVAIAGATNDFNLLATGGATSIMRVPTGTANPTFSGTLTATGFSGNHTGTILTAAQGNITSLGTLTGLAVAGNITMSAGGLFTGLGKFALGNGLGAQITLAKVSTVAPVVANAAQQAWLKVVGDDAVTYYLPAFN